MRGRVVSFLVVASLAILPAAPAHALFGIGDIVLDPTNLAQNVLTASRTLQQVRIQARMLQAQVKELRRLGINSGPEITRILDELAYLKAQGDALTYQVEHTARVFRETYPDLHADWEKTDLAELSDAQWRTTRAAWESSLVVQSAVSEAIAADSRVLRQMTSRSTVAQGNLAAVQAGNELQALAIKQDLQLQQMLAAHYRAETLAKAREEQVIAQGRERTRRFLDVDSGIAAAGRAR